MCWYVYREKKGGLGNVSSIMCCGFMYTYRGPCISKPGIVLSEFDYLDVGVGEQSGGGGGELGRVATNSDWFELRNGTNYGCECFLCKSTGSGSERWVRDGKGGGQGGISEKKALRTLHAHASCRDGLATPSKSFRGAPTLLAYENL